MLYFYDYITALLHTNLSSEKHGKSVKAKLNVKRRHASLEFLDEMRHLRSDCARTCTFSALT